MASSLLRLCLVWLIVNEERVHRAGLRGLSACVLVLVGAGCNAALDAGPSVPFARDEVTADDRAVYGGDRLTRRHDGTLRLEGCASSDCPVIANELECLHIEVSGTRSGEVCGRCTVEVAGFTVSKEICGAAEGLPLRCGVDTRHFASDFSSCQQRIGEDTSGTDGAEEASPLRARLRADTCVQHRLPAAGASRLEPPASAVAVAYEAAYNALLALATRQLGGAPLPAFSLAPAILEQLAALDEPKARSLGVCVLDAAGYSTEGIETIFARENLSRSLLESMVLPNGFYASSTPIEVWALLEAASRLGLRLPDLGEDMNDLPPALRPAAFSVSLLFSEVRDTERRRTLRDTLVSAGRAFRETSLPSAAHL